jgi:two-component system chemotaxis response regulator CheB
MAFQPVAAKVIDVLVVDDAVVVRRIVSDVLASDPGIRVIGTAADGRIALQKLEQTKADIVTLDFEMPEMNGIETLKEIRRKYPRLPVIMFSTLTARGAVETLDALSCGASDYVTKPSNVGSVMEAQDRIRQQLIPKIKALCERRADVRAQAMPAPAPVAAVKPAVTAAPPSCVAAIAIGVSTGGPNALAELIPKLPADLPVPVLIVQHMPPMFTKLLADRLNVQSGLTVVEAKSGEVLMPGTVYIAPGDRHLTLRREGVAVVTALDQDPPENSCRPAVDVLFRSASAVYRENLLAVVLTGMGQDGLRGCEEVRRLHGRVLAQDEATSVVWGMPGFVVSAGLAERVLPLGEMAGEITRRAARRKP